MKGEYNGHLVALVQLLESKGATEDPSVYVSIHTHQPVNQQVKSPPRTAAHILKSPLHSDFTYAIS